jgi:hypothetical protein
MGNFIQQSRISELKQKYHSINSLKDSEKIQVVKDKSLNPFLFDNHVDGIANSMSRWAQDAPQFAGRTDGEKLQIASRYYDEALAPLYIKAGAPPLSRDTWLRNAWKSALTYDPSQTYRNPILKGALHGEDSAIAQVMNATRTLTNIAGLPIVAMEDSIKSGDFTGLVGWHNLYMNMHNRIKEDGVVTGIAKAIEDTGERNPTGGSKWMHNVASQMSFWRDVTPARTFSESATSMVVENAMLLPLFGGIGKASEMGIGLVAKSADGIPVIKNLTQVLGASKVGQQAAKMLTYGTEGLIYHDLTTDTPDKKDAWKTALQFAAMGTLFSGFGKGASKLVDMLPEGAEKDAMNAAEKEANLGAQGKQSATADDYLRQYRVHMASVMAAGGRAGTASVVEEALAHVVMEEKAPMDEMDALKFQQDRSDEDPVHWKTVFANMTIIKQFLGEQGWKLSEFKPDDPRWEDLKGFINTQLDQAADEMDLHVPQVQEMKGQELLDDYMKTPEGKAEWQQELAKAQEAFKNHPGGAEKAPVVAKAAMLKRRVAAVQKAAEERTVTGPENVERNQPGMAGVEQLPAGLRGAKPRYSYGPNNSFELRFEDPRDMAAYVLGNPGKSNAHADFLEYYKKQFSKGTDEANIQAHARRVRAAIKEQAKNWDGEGKKVLRVKSTVPKPAEAPSMETASRKVDSRYEYDKSGKVTGYQMGISFNWKVAAKNAATAKGGTNTTKFWQEYVDSLVGKTDDDVSAAHAFADDLRTYFNPLKEYGLTFEKANTKGGDWTNFLAFMHSYKDKLPGPVANKLEDILMNSPKMSALLGRKTTTEGIKEFGQAIQNHVDIFTRSDWYKKYGKRNVFHSSQPGISGENSLSKWQRDKKLIESAHKNDLAKGKEFYPGKSKAMLEARARYETTLKKLQAQELALYLKGKPHKVAGLISKIREHLAASGGN